MRVPAPQLRCHVRGSGCGPEGHSCLLSASSRCSSPPSDLPHYLLSHHRSHLRCSHRRPQPAPRGAGAAGEERGAAGARASPPGLRTRPGHWGRGASPLRVLLGAQMDTGQRGCSRPARRDPWAWCLSCGDFRAGRQAPVCQARLRAASQALHVSGARNRAGLLAAAQTGPDPAAGIAEHTPACSRSWVWHEQAVVDPGHRCAPQRARGMLRNFASEGAGIKQGQGWLHFAAGMRGKLRAERKSEEAPLSPRGTWQPLRSINSSCCYQFVAY